MSTTTIRLPADLKERVAAAAQRQGKTAHGYIIEAIAEKAEADLRRLAFEAEAEARYARIAENGKTVGWPEMRKYLEARLSDQPARRPGARKLAR
jgi:predicted DNA-binding protein